MREAEASLRKRILTLPVPTARLASTYHREANIERLARRLADNETQYDEA